MKRRNRHGKLTTAELIEAGYVAEANELRQRLALSKGGKTAHFRFWKDRLKPEQRFSPV